MLQSVTLPTGQVAMYLSLFEGGVIPLYGCLPGLTWVLHDYFQTLEDEVLYVWPQKWNIGKVLFMLVRYYGIALLVFDVTQIHLFSRPGIKSDTVCIATDPITRVAGAILLWTIEIVMQLRIYALYGRSYKVGLLNLVLFVASIAAFLWVVIHDTIVRAGLIEDAVAFPLPGCPTLQPGIEWAQWVPATIFEGLLFCWALYKTLETTIEKWQSGLNVSVSLCTLILRDNSLYFFGITCLLILTNLMVVGVTELPWFSYGPFHAAMEVMTSRMLINLYKATSRTSTSIWNSSQTSAPTATTL